MSNAREPLKDDVRGHGVVTDSVGNTVCTVNDPRYARRIVACVNACAGVPIGVLQLVGACGGFGRDRMVEHVTKQRDKLHRIVCDCLTAVGNGSGATDQASIEFLSGSPEEIKLEVTALKRQRDELLAAAQNAIDECCDLVATPAGESLRAAIAKVKGAA